MSLLKTSKTEIPVPNSAATFLTGEAETEYFSQGHVVLGRIQWWCCIKYTYNQVIWWCTKTLGLFTESVASFPITRTPSKYYMHQGLNPNPIPLSQVPNWLSYYHPKWNQIIFSLINVNSCCNVIVELLHKSKFKLPQMLLFNLKHILESQKRFEFGKIFSISSWLVNYLFLLFFFLTILLPPLSQNVRFFVSQKCINDHSRE